MGFSPRDRETLRGLARRVAEIAALPVHARKAELWRRLNDLDPVRPMVYINEIPWHEMDVDGELELRCEDPLCRHVERGLRRTTYLWEHMPADMVVEGRLLAPRAVKDTGFGLSWQGATCITDRAEGAIISRHFEPQIREESDIERIRAPRLTEDAEGSRRNLEVLSEAFGDILTVEPGGMTNVWFAPWDQLSMWCGVQQMLTDLALRPGFMHRLMDRLVEAHLVRLEQIVELGLLLRNERNVRIGSGGYGYTADLPAPGAAEGAVVPGQTWGCAAAQPFSEVSPAMHEEFALRYEKPWLERFGLTYYGCCEPLHRKVELLRSVPNLRKVSMSPRADPAVGAEAVGRQYVFSWKPNPAVLATDRWNPQAAREAIRETLAKTRGCAVEIIMKDVSTVRYEPQRLWEWSRIAVEEAEKAA